MKSEIRMTKSERNPNDEIRKSSAGGEFFSDLGFRNSFVIRHSSFVISSAFTLIEMLLALAISAIVVAGIGGVFYSAVRLRETTAAALDEAAPLQHALAFIRRDLRGALPPSGYLAGDFKSGTVSGGLGQSAGIGLQFYTSTGTMREDAPWGDIQQVVYELRPAAQSSRAGGNDLIRTVTRNVLGTTPQSEEQWLLGNVQSVEFGCYDGADWRPSWDTTLGNTNLPSAVRVRLQLAKASSTDTRKQEPVEMVVAIVTQSRTNQTQSAGGGQ